jgi:predicted MPP superfamily phosphohydrolase
MIEIFHVSDLHFGKHKKQTYNAKALLKKIREKFVIEKGGNKYLLVTGDIVDDGLKKQYKRATKALIPLKENVLVVPGNHDYATQGFLYRKKLAKNFDDHLVKELGINHLYFPKKPFTKVIKDEDGSKVLIIGLNSCLKTSHPFDLAAGKIGEKQRDNLKRILNNQAYQYVPKIVFLHHIPHRRAHGIGMSLKDYKKLMGIVRNRVDVLAFGHEGRIKDLEQKEIEKLKFSDHDKKRLRSIKRMSIPIRMMKLRSGRRQGIRYYLDANKSVNEQACYRIRIEGNKVSARLMRLDYSN